MKEQRQFFIVALPRSRTTWLANWLTQAPVSFCHHDLLGDVLSKEDYAQRIERTPGQFVGDSDSGLPFLFDRLPAWFPKARFVFVRRSVEDSFNSLCRFVPGKSRRELLPAFHQCAIAFERMNRLYRDDNDLRPRCRFVRYEDLAEVREAAALWDFCLPGVPFDLERWRMLDAMRVEPRECHLTVKGNFLWRSE